MEEAIIGLCGVVIGAAIALLSVRTADKRWLYRQALSDVDRALERRAEATYGTQRGTTVVITEDDEPYADDLSYDDPEPIPLSLADLPDDVPIEDRLAILKQNNPELMDEDDDDEPEPTHEPSRKAGKARKLFLSDTGTTFDMETGREVP